MNANQPRKVNDIRHNSDKAADSRAAEAQYRTPALIELGKTAELVQGGTWGGFPDNYTGYRTYR